MTELEIFNEALFVDSHQDAVRETQKWTLERLLQWPDDLRPGIAQLLIDKVRAWGVEPPAIWEEAILNPSLINDLHDDRSESEMDEWEDPRPTHDAEEDILA